MIAVVVDVPGRLTRPPLGTWVSMGHAMSTSTIPDREEYWRCRYSELVLIWANKELFTPSQ